MADKGAQSMFTGGKMDLDYTDIGELRLNIAKELLSSSNNLILLAVCHSPMLFPLAL